MFRSLLVSLSLSIGGECFKSQFLLLGQVLTRLDRNDSVERSLSRKHHPQDEHHGDEEIWRVDDRSEIFFLDDEFDHHRKNRRRNVRSIDEHQRSSPVPSFPESHDKNAKAWKLEQHFAINERAKPNRNSVHQEVTGPLILLLLLFLELFVGFDYVRIIFFKEGFREKVLFRSEKEKSFFPFSFWFSFFFFFFFCVSFLFLDGARNFGVKRKLADLGVPDEEVFEKGRMQGRRSNSLEIDEKCDWNVRKKEDKEENVEFSL